MIWWFVVWCQVPFFKVPGTIFPIMNILLFVFLLLIIFILVVYCWWLVVWAIGGIGIMPTSRQAIKTLKLILKKYSLDNKVFIDLGCGQGQVARQIKKAFPEMKVVGIEKAPSLWIFGLIKNIFSFHKIKFLRQNLFDADILKADVIYFYLPRPLLPRLEQKLKKELKTGAVIITNTVSFEDWPPIETVVTNESSPNFEKLYVYKI